MHYTTSLRQNLIFFVAFLQLGQKLDEIWRVAGVGTEVEKGTCKPQCHFFTLFIFFSSFFFLLFSGLGEITTADEVLEVIKKSQEKDKGWKKRKSVSALQASVNQQSLPPDTELQETPLSKKGVLEAIVCLVLRPMMPFCNKREEVFLAHAFIFRQQHTCNYRCT